MQTQNSTTKSDHHMLEAQIDALKDGVKKLVDRVTAKPSGEPSRLRAFAGKATETIKAHPIAAATVALGLGYLVVRVARR